MLFNLLLHVSPKCSEGPGRWSPGAGPQGSGAKIQQLSVFCRGLHTEAYTAYNTLSLSLSLSLPLSVALSLSLFCSRHGSRSLQCGRDP